MAGGDAVAQDGADGLEGEETAGFHVVNTGAMCLFAVHVEGHLAQRAVRPDGVEMARDQDRLCQCTPGVRAIRQVAEPGRSPARASDWPPTAPGSRSATSTSRLTAAASVVGVSIPTQVESSASRESELPASEARHRAAHPFGNPQDERGNGTGPEACGEEVGVQTT